METIRLQIEALIFASEQSLSIGEIKQVIFAALNEDYPADEIHTHLEAIREKYDKDDQVFSLREIAGGYQFLTKSNYYALIRQLQVQRSKKKLSQAALETLAIIAYRQPITKLEIEQIRGVNCDYSIQRLLEKELIAIKGKASTPGKPLLYGTSTLFMDYFGLKSHAELPQIKDLGTDANEIGEKTE